MNGDDDDDDRRLSRRGFLRGRGLGRIIDDTTEAVRGRALDGDEPARSAAEPSTRFRKSFPILRPPRAIEEDAFLDGCTRCDACLEACPHDSIVHAPIRFRRAAGTPMIDPMRQPCWMCDDTPCVSACEPKVLDAALLIRMATARISPITCLAHQNLYGGSFCTACSEQCPVPGAIEIVNGKPRIVETVCTGCGVCQHVCPAPENAVLLMPMAERPAPPSSSPGAPSAQAPSDPAEPEPGE